VNHEVGTTFKEINLGQFTIFASGKYSDQLDIRLEPIGNTDANITAAIQRCITEDHAKVVMAVQSFIRPPVLQLVIANPSVTFLNIRAAQIPVPPSTTLPPPNFYFSVPQGHRTWFVKGAAAAYASQTGHAGMVVPLYDNYQVATSANAFYLGMKSVNPDATLRIVNPGIGFQRGVQDTQAIDRLLQADPSIDVVTQQKAALNIRDYVVNVVNPGSSHPVYLIENEFSLGMPASALEAVTNSTLILTATMFDFQPILNDFADKYLAGTLVPGNIDFVSKVGNDPIMSLTAFSNVIPASKRASLIQLSQKYLKETEDPFCGPLAMKYLSDTYQFINGCVPDYALLTKIEYSPGIITDRA
jgi:basic membrane lipoprotein Med (substrate-binding protein (PBP1-ABC) superfamily)